MNDVMIATPPTTLAERLEQHVGALREALRIVEALDGGPGAPPVEQALVHGALSWMAVAEGCAIELIANLKRIEAAIGRI